MEHLVNPPAEPWLSRAVPWCIRHYALDAVDAAESSVRPTKLWDPSLDRQIRRQVLQSRPDVSRKHDDQQDHKPGSGQRRNHGQKQSTGGQQFQYASQRHELRAYT